MTEATGAIVLNHLPRTGTREQIEEYLAKFARNISRDRIPGLLASTPVILSHHVTASVARNVVQELEHLGASAIFVPSRTNIKKRRISSMLPLIHQRDTIAALTSSFLQQVQKSEEQALLLTSCRRAEGKSTVALNLARGLVAEAGLKILLVDTNGDGCITHRVFGVNRTPGLTDLLVGGERYGDTLRYSHEFGFYYLTFGSKQYGRLVPFTGPRNKIFSKFLAGLKNDFDYILLDGPSLAGPSDPLLIAPALDGVILVVACEQTPREVVLAADTRLRRRGVEPLGIILNRRPYYLPEKLV